MKFLFACAALFLAFSSIDAQTPESSPSQLDALTRKLDEINTKLDTLSQQILKLEQQSPRPGVMIGETTPTPSSNSPSVAPALPALPSSSPGGGNTHVVAKGETLTSIAKQTKVSVEDLQKFNHIEDGRKLQAGQTIMIPPLGAGPSPTASPAPSLSP